MITKPTPEDLFFLHRTLVLARRGSYRTRPNPLVGAVVVRNGKILSEGYHHRLGAAHAEVDALDKIHGHARGATIFVSLEPCSHHGRTPPCTERLIAEGISRSVCCTRDPNPRVAGNGLQILSDHGIEAACGGLTDEAFSLNRVYFKNVAANLPYVILKAGMSLDGKIATSRGESRWITSEGARRYSHGLRSTVDGLMVGIKTVLSDNPQLTARTGRRNARQPTSLILDSELRTPPEAALLQASPKKTIIFTSHRASEDKAQRLRAVGAEVLRVASGATGLDLHEVLAAAFQRSIYLILVEGGGAVHFSLLKAGLADEIMFFIAPLLLGGQTAAAAIGGEGFARLAEGAVIDDVHCRRIGSDLMLGGSIRQSWRASLLHKLQAE